MAGRFEKTYGKLFKYFLFVVNPFKKTRTSPEIAWPIALLRKEKVGSVTIYTGAYEIINEADIY